ncbi:hypothetical protein WJX74_007278 [Apatococcus lobatus]|uniref:Uncharacterized protein n=1 Tax=Apatococcus lobatus TaxID=904363 RepID=A0AAW1QBW2_9CHLO
MWLTANGGSWHGCFPHQHWQHRQSSTSGTTLATPFSSFRLLLDHGVLLRELPIVDSFPLPFKDSLFHVGSRAPAEWHASKPKWWLYAYRISPTRAGQGIARAQPGLRIPDLCGGVGTALVAAVQAGKRVDQYCLVEISPVARSMAQHIREQLRQQYPLQLSPAAIAQVQTLPQDITMVTQEQVNQLGPFDLIVTAWPCQGLSKANRTAQGLADARSGLFYNALQMLRWNQQLKASTAFIFENDWFQHHQAAPVRQAWNTELC